MKKSDVVNFFGRAKRCGPWLREKLLDTLTTKISDSVSEGSAPLLDGVTTPVCPTLTHSHMPLKNRLHSVKQALILHGTQDTDPQESSLTHQRNETSFCICKPIKNTLSYD